MKLAKVPLALPPLPRVPAALSSRPVAAGLVALLSAGLLAGVLSLAGGGRDAAVLPGRGEAPPVDSVARGGASSGAYSEEASASQAPAMAAADKAASRGGVAASAPGQPAVSGQAQPLPPAASIDRMIVKSGSLTLEVTSLESAVQRVGSVVAGIPGAYIAASSTSYRTGREGAGGGPAGIAPGRPVQDIVPRPVPPPDQTATLTIKVPADAFGELVQRLRELGSPMYESIGTQEVTEEFVDLEAQVRNLESTEQQYLRLLERAQRIEEILPIQQRITDVRNQIERLRGRMNLLQRRADTSTVTVSLVVPSAKTGSIAGEPRAVRTLRGAWSQLGVFLQGTLDVAIYLAVYAIPLLPFAVAYVWWRSRSRRPAPAATSPGGVI